MVDSERRRAARWPVPIFVRGEPYGGVTRDLSRGGAYLLTSERPEIGQIDEVAFVWGRDEFPCKAQVVRHGSDGVGLAFVEVAPNVDAALCDILDG